MSSFLSALKARCEVVTLDGGKDYRRSSEEEPQEKWFSLDQDGFEESWASVEGKEGVSSPPSMVPYQTARVDTTADKV